jgi:AAA-like domain
MARSLQLRPECLDLARAALKRLGLTQIGLGIQAEIQSPSTLCNFFGGRPVSRGNFHKLCELLSINADNVGRQPLTAPAIVNHPTLHPDPYLCRSGEESWYSMFFERHSLIRIQAPSQFGKTLLMSRMLERAEQQGHLSLYLTLNGIDAASFRDSQTFFRHFICEIENEIAESSIDLLMPLDRYDDYAARSGHFKAAVKYLEHLQKNLSQPFTLGINKLDRLLDDPQTAKTASDFLYLLRYMNEKSKSSKVWKNFRLVLAYTVLRFEDSVPIAATQSPFNVGYPIDLREFSPSEVAELAAKKGLNLDELQIQALMKPIGGIPNLIQLTINTLRERGEKLLEDPAAITSIYQAHLEELEGYLRRENLDVPMNQIATAGVDINGLDKKIRNLLHRQGLIITTIDRQVLPRCELYLRHFSQHQS